MHRLGITVTHAPTSPAPPPPIRALARCLLGLAAGALLLLSVAACGGSGSAKSRFTANLHKLGLSGSEASCVTDHLYGSLSSAEVQQFFSAAEQGGGNRAAIPAPLLQKLATAVAPCAPPASSASTSQPTSS